MAEKTKGWPPKRRQKQAENMRKTKPWKRTTGPRTAAGKEAAKYNALKHGFYTPEADALRATLKDLRDMSQSP